MKTVDLEKEQRSLIEVLALAKSEAVLIHSASGDFLLEHADAFDRETAALGNSEKFLAFLDTRSKENGDISLANMREKRGMPARS
jgi:hypothetical protein